jgi:integrase
LLEIRLHDLRHTAATISLIAGVPPRVISEQLDHARSCSHSTSIHKFCAHMQAKPRKRYKRC